MDPYSKAIAVPKGYSRRSASLPGDNCATAMKSVVADPSHYDWEGDVPLERPLPKLSSTRCTWEGSHAIPIPACPRDAGHVPWTDRKIPYLKDLGITAVELLPVFQFDERTLEKAW